MSMPPIRDGLFDRCGDLRLRARRRRWATRPPACSISAATVWIVPGSFACGVDVLAAITTLAPSRQRNAIARPMPRLAPVMNSVWSRNGS
jgi:hypothetical protein